MRLLSVEDHSETRRILERALREAGHEADSAGSLTAARHKLARGAYAAAIVDWMLPDGDGVDLCRELRSGSNAMPILLLSSRGEVEDRVKALDAGADDHLR